MNWYKLSQTQEDSNKKEKDAELRNLELQLESKYPGLDLCLWLTYGDYIEVAAIKVPPEMQNKGIGHSVMEVIKDKAREWGVPVVLSPEPSPRKKKKLMDFYKDLGFVPNKGRNKNYQLSSPFAPTMYWRP